ncbi:MAG: alpha/beta hydrolase [Oscillospiraceae bacterium]|jgi:pimeloyl-ACP methyl ester carboxylesterase|nr:alpha/beta hydrolase [Oscillospiraceae bacterium]
MTIDVAGQPVAFEEAGRGEVILLLHGWGASARLYAPLQQLLAQKYRVLAPDFPGFGESPEPPAAWDVDAYADWVLGFLAALGVAQCALVGHSFGGRVILKLAARQLPEPRFTKIVLIDSAGIKPTPGKQALRRSRRYRLGRKLLECPPVRRLCPGALEALRQKHGSADYKAASPLMRQVLVRTVAEDLTPLLPQIQPPTLLIWGRNDADTPLADGRLMESRIPGAGLVILENAGHFSFLEQQPQFLRVIASFFKL